MRLLPFARDLERNLTHSVLPIWVLQELADRGDTYGYALMERLRERGGPNYRVPPSVLYPLLARLRADGFVESLYGRESHGPVRKYYRITSTGRRALREAERVLDRMRPGPETVGRPSEPLATVSGTPGRV
jgi:DNA-binding PadR family transcriptional regulator